jgi:hypothetical protein
MPTKTRSITTADENTEHLAAAQASRDAFATAQELAIEREADHENAELHAAEIEASYSQGDDRITASIYGDALTEVTRSEMLHNAAQAAEKRALAGVISTDVTLANLALPWLQSALKGVDCRASFYAPKTSPDKPVAYAIQRTPTVSLGGGSISSGKGNRVEVRYYRPDLYRAVVASDIKAAAEQAHCTVEAASSGSQAYGDNMRVDSVWIDIQRGQSIVPLIVTPPTSVMASSNVAHAFASNLVMHCKASTDPDVRGTLDKEYEGAAITVKPLSGKVVNIVVDDDGVRTTTVKLSLNYHRNGDRTLNVEKHFKDVLNDWQGSFVVAFGMVSSITGSLGFPNQMIPATTPIEVEAVFTSRVR